MKWILIFWIAGWTSPEMHQITFDTWEECDKLVTQISGADPNDIIKQACVPSSG